MTHTRLVAVLVACHCTVAAGIAAQGLPTYVPINPLQTSRSALFFPAYEAPAPNWRLTTQLDWSSIIEVGPPDQATTILLDAEVVRLGLTLIKDYGPSNFLMISVPVGGAYDGVLDGFFNWYHDFTGLRVAAREERPRNEFAYTLVLPDGETRRYHPSDFFLGDITVGVGVRNSPSLQTLVFATLPTHTHADGFGRGVISANGIITARSQLSERLLYEGSLGIGWTPRHGDLAEYQKTVFWSASSGLRFRFWGRQALFFNAFHQSGSYRNTTLPPLDGSELTADMGFLLRPGRSAPELILALTEDLKPTGPAIDAAFRIGLRW